MDPVTIGVMVGGAVTAIAATVRTAVVWRTKRTMLREALENAPPDERAKIIRSMRGLFKSDYQLGPFRRRPPLESGEDGEKVGGAS